MAYLRFSALSLTAVAVLTTFLALPCPRRDDGPDPSLVRAYTNHRRLLADLDIIIDVQVDGDRLRITPGRRWQEVNKEMQRIHTRVLAEGLLGNRDACCLIEAP